MLPGYAPFLAAIVAYPDDDLQKLIYADWLEEQGDADRAEFIRLHIEKVRTNEKRFYPRPMTARATELRKSHEGQWRAELPSLPGVTWGRMWDGFVSEAKFASPLSLIEHAAVAFAATPIRVVQLSELVPDTVEAICALPQLGKLYGLRLDDVSLNPAIWQTLTTGSWFPHIQHLIVHPNTTPLSPPPASVNLKNLIPRLRRRQLLRDSSVWQQQERATRQLWGEQLIRMVIASANHERSRLRLVHLNMPFIDRELIRSVDFGRLKVTGLEPEDNDFDPL